MNIKVERTLKIIGFSLAGLLGVTFLAWATLNIIKYPLYSEYYSIRKDRGRIPGLKDGFVAQGITEVDGTSYDASAGYLSNGEASRIYFNNYKENTNSYVKMKRNGVDFLGHTGGLAYSNSYFYLANEKGNDAKNGGIYKFKVDDYSKNGEVEIGDPISVNNNSSFIFTDDEFIYVGEYNDDKKYACDHFINVTDSLKYAAIITKYSINDLSKPLAIYSIRNNVQGCAFVKGKAILSISHSVTSSYYYIYDLSKQKTASTKIDDLEVIILGEEEKSIKAPAMSEDLDVVGENKDELLTISESSCTKYIFGSFFFANYYYTLRIE